MSDADEPWFDPAVDGLPEFQLEDGKTGVVTSGIVIRKVLHPDGGTVVVTSYSDGMNVAEVFGLLQLEADRFRSKWAH